MYRVLWIDDQHEKMTGFKGQAKLKSINLIPFKSAEKAVEELESNPLRYDAILLDALFFMEEDDTAGSESLEGLFKTKEKIEKLVDKLQFFVFTGQEKLDADTTFNLLFPTYYRKGVKDDVVDLLSDLVNACENTERYIVKEKYSSVFNVVEKYLGEDLVPAMIKLIAESEAEKAGLYRADFIDIRKVVERVFKVIYERGLIPDEVYNGNGSITGCSKYLSSFVGMDYIPNNQILPPAIAYILRSMLTIVQDACHAEGNLNYAVDNYVKTTNSSFVYRSCLYQLLEFICWTKNYLDTEPIPGDWVKKQEVEAVSADRELKGIIINRNVQKGFAFFQPHGETSGIFIPPNVVPDFHFKEDDIFKATIEDYKDRNSGETKQRVKILEKVES